LESAVEGIHHGIDDYLIKPAGADALVAALAEKLAARRPKARILTNSYDVPRVRTRHMLFEHDGYEVVSTSDLQASLEQCKRTDFDVFILGHSIPHADKEKLVKIFRENCLAPVISLRAFPGEQSIDGAHYQIESDPQTLLGLVAKIVAGRAMNLDEQ
jgi:DNA-binding response OmpR family regulator